MTPALFQKWLNIDTNTAIRLFLVISVIGIAVFLYISYEKGFILW